MNEHEANPAQRKIGIVLVDHGSRRVESNDLLLEVARMFRETSGFEVVEPAHMELAEPTIAVAIDRCVQRGVDLVVVLPYFLGPGNHSRVDIPQLAREAAGRHDGLECVVAEPLGLHPLMSQIMSQRVHDCLELQDD